MKEPLKSVPASFDCFPLFINHHKCALQNPPDFSTVSPIPLAFGYLNFITTLRIFANFAFSSDLNSVIIYLTIYAHISIEMLFALPQFFIVFRLFASFPLR